MATTVINLSDPVSTFVTKTNLVSQHLGDQSTLPTIGINGANQLARDSDAIKAIGQLHSLILKTDSADIISLIKSSLQKDSANAIGFDSAQGRFFVLPNTIDSNMIETLAIKTKHIFPDAINGAKIADNVINSEHFVDGSIDSEHLASLVISTGKIQADAVTEAKIGDDAVGSVQLKSLSTLLIKDSAGSTLKTIHGAGA